MLISSLVISGSTAGFSARTPNSGNVITANHSFGPSDYHGAVLPDAPWALYDLDDANVAVAFFIFRKRIMNASAGAVKE